MEVGTFGNTRFIFVKPGTLLAGRHLQGHRRCAGRRQSLPSGVGPEGALAIPSRNLYVTANETDLSLDGAAPAHVMIYELSEGEPAYPTIMSDLDANVKPIGWAALSGAVADAEKPGILYAVSDSVFTESRPSTTIDATAKPARIVKKTVITRNGAPAQKLDLEGITLDGEGGFWLASEGDTGRDPTPHALFHVNADGEIEDEIAFPSALLAHEIRSGSEGIAAIGEGDDMTLWIAIQREWKDDEKGFVKLVSYNPASEEWGAVRYPLESPCRRRRVGLSEITVHGDFAYIVERDNQIAANAQLKAIYRVPVSELVSAPLDGELPVVSKELVRDLVPDLKAFNGYVVDKVESLAIDSTGTGYVITDNDGVDDPTRARPSSGPSASCKATFRHMPSQSMSSRLSPG